ncbi:MAG: dicarboxylate/amino acid:cation symporter [Bacteroidales bacterium]
MKPVRASLFTWILAGMLLGAVIGWMAVEWGFSGFVTTYVKPLGTIFLNLLKMIAIPLVFVSLVNGIASMANLARLSRIAFKVFGLYLCTTTLAVVMALVLVSFIKPGAGFPRESLSALSTESLPLQGVEADPGLQDAGPLQFLTDMVPSNLVQSWSDNSNMLQIIFFAIIFSLAIVQLPREKTNPVRAFFASIDAILLQIIHIIMRFAPVGVFALMAALFTDFSASPALFSSLGWYVLTVLLGLSLMLVLIYPLLVAIFSRMPVRFFLRKMLPVQVMAFSTSSSASTLPFTLRQTTDQMKVSPEIAGFSLPTGVTINMDGTSIYQVVAIIFIAEAFAIDLTFSQQLLLILMTILSSVGTPGIPGGSIVMILAVMSMLHIPPAGLALVMGVDRVLDMFRTVVNVTGDVAVAVVVAHSEEAIDYSGIER